MLTITKEQKEKAIAIGRKHNVEKVFINDKGEFFTVENYARLSVNSDKEKIAIVSVTALSSSEKKQKNENQTTEANTVAELISAIESASDASEVQDIIKAESNGLKRSSVLKAAGERIKQLKLDK